MINDAHIHLFAHGALSGAAASAVAYNRARDRLLIDRALVVGYEGTAEHAGNNEAILQLSHAQTWMRCVAFVSLKAPLETHALDHIAARGFVGISLYVETREDAQALGAWPPIDGASFPHGTAVVSVNAPIHLLPFIAPTIAGSVRSQWLISHLGLPGKLDSTAIRPDNLAQLEGAIALASLSQAGVKLSGLYALGKAGMDPAARSTLLRHYLDAYGPERAYWGSDFPPVLDHWSIRQTMTAIESLGLSRTQSDQVFGSNLAALL